MNYYTQIVLGFKLAGNLTLTWNLSGLGVKTAIFSLAAPYNSYGSFGTGYSDIYSKSINGKVSMNGVNWIDVSSVNNNVAGYTYFRIYATFGYEDTSTAKGCTITASNVKFYT